MEKKLMFLASFLLVVLVKSSEGIQCYVCFTGCEDPFNEADATLTSCTGDVSCFKFKNSLTGITRGCNVAKAGDDCSSAETIGFSVETCTCNSDECNHAVRTKLSTSLLVFTSLAYLLFRVF